MCRMDAALEQNMDIKDGTLEGFSELLIVYGKNLVLLSDLWVGIATKDDEDDNPSEVWINDAKPVRELGQVMVDASQQLTVIWGQMPVDLQEIVDIKVRKVKQIEENK